MEKFQERNFPTELGNAAGAAFALLPPPRRRDMHSRWIFEGGRRIADLAISISLLLSKQKQSKGGNQLFSFRLRPF
jgi:hypothetical protein